MQALANISPGPNERQRFFELLISVVVDKNEYILSQSTQFLKMQLDFLGDKSMKL